MPTVDVYPKMGETYPDAQGVPITSAGARVFAVKYIEDALRDGFVLTWDPLGIFHPDDRTDDVEALDGTTGGAVTAYTVISVDFGYGTEVAYSSFAFHPPYATSSTINLLTGAYHLVRDGGFPVTEDPPAVVVIQPPARGPAEWGLIYSVDLTAQPTQAIVAAGAYTIGGRTWYAKGAVTGLPSGLVMSSDLINGVGLRIGTNNAQNIGSGLDYPGRWFGLPLTSFPELTPSVPFLVRARFSYEDTANSTSWIGLVDSTSDGAPLLQAQRGRDNLAGNQRTYSNTSGMAAKVGGSGFGENVSIVRPSGPVASGVYGFMTLNAQQVTQGAQTAVGPGVSDSPSDFRCIQAPVTGVGMITISYANPMIAFLLSNNGPHAVAMTHLSIHQLRSS